MATEIQTIKASQLEELTEVTDSNYVVVTDGATSKIVKATKLKGNSLTSIFICFQLIQHSGPGKSFKITKSKIGLFFFIQCPDTLPVNRLDLPD